MYGALWRILPGPVWLRVVILLVALAALLYVLATWIFPWVQDLTTVPDTTVGTP